MKHQEIYDLYYTGSHVCSLLPFKFFSTNGRMLNILGAIYTMEYSKV